MVHHEVIICAIDGVEVVSWLEREGFSTTIAEAEDGTVVEYGHQAPTV